MRHFQHLAKPAKLVEGLAGVRDLVEHEHEHELPQLLNEALDGPPVDPRVL